MHVRYNVDSRRIDTSYYRLVRKITVSAVNKRAPMLGDKSNLNMSEGEPDTSVVTRNATKATIIYEQAIKRICSLLNCE